MKVIFTCGGTAGHVNPALALAGYMRKKDPTVEVLFVGTPEGIERDLVAQAGYDYRGIAVGSLERSVSWEAIRHNCKSAWEMLALRRKTGAILKEFPADLVVGTGGYASYPMVKYAALRGIPTAVHEANMIPGLTTKMLEKHASRIMVGFEECRALYKHPERIAVTGTPVRGDFFDLTHEEAKAALGMGKDDPLVVSFWGSLGASTMNRQMLDFFKKEKEDGYPFYHIHAVGGRGWETMQQEMQKAGLPGSHKLDVRKYIYDMAVVMRAADLVICRGIYHQRDYGSGGADHHCAVAVCGQQPPGEERADSRTARGRVPDPGGGVQRREALSHGEGYSGKPHTPGLYEPGHGGTGYFGRYGADL